MKGFQKFLKPNVLLAFGAGVGVSAYAAVQFKHRVYCDSVSDYTFNPNTPTNIPSGYPKWDYDWDKRQPYSLVARPQGKVDNKTEEKYHEQLENSKCKSVRHIYLIRVGEYDEEKPPCEQLLTKLGKDQVALAAKRLQAVAKQKDIEFTSVVCSQTPAAVESAELIQKNLGQKGLRLKEKDPMLEEGCPSLPEPGSPSFYPEPKQLYTDGSRIEAAFRKYFHRANPTQEKDSFEIIVCDANVLRYFLCRALQFPAQGWLRMMLAHGSINVVSINPKGGVVLRAVGESGFLPPSKLTA